MKTNPISKALAIASIALSFSIIAKARDDPSSTDSSAATRYILYKTISDISRPTDNWTVTLHPGETFIGSVFNRYTIKID